MVENSVKASFSVCNELRPLKQGRLRAPRGEKQWRPDQRVGSSGPERRVFVGAKSSKGSNTWQIRLF